MRRSKPFETARAILALGLLVLAGCRHVPSRQETDATMLGGRTASSKIRPSQVADVQVAYAHTLEAQGQGDDAIGAYQQALKHDPSRADALVRLAVLHDRKAKFAESAAFYQKALEARPADPEIFCDKGYSLYLQRRLNDAEATLRQAIALRPDFPRAHNNLGLVLGHEGRRSEALAEFRKSGCSVADAHLNLAFVLTMDGRWEDARKQYALVMTADPSSNSAKAGLRDVDRLATRVPALAQAVDKADAAVTPTANTAVVPPARKKVRIQPAPAGLGQGAR